MEDWKQRLQPFGEMYHQFAHRMRLELEKMSDDQLKQILVDCEGPTKTNCWWAIDSVTPQVRNQTLSILEFRAMKKESAHE